MANLTISFDGIVFRSDTPEFKLVFPYKATFKKLYIEIKERGLYDNLIIMVVDCKLTDDGDIKPTTFTLNGVNINDDLNSFLISEYEIILHDFKESLT